MDPGHAGKECTPWVDFNADGTYSGSDAANGIGGRWAAEGGAFFATSRPQTLVGCYSSSDSGAGLGIPEIVDWITAARAAALDGATLVLVDPDGTELGRLHRA